MGVQLTNFKQLHDAIVLWWLKIVEECVATFGTYSPNAGDSYGGKRGSNPEGGKQLLRYFNVLKGKFVSNIVC